MYRNVFLLLAGGAIGAGAATAYPALTAQATVTIGQSIVHQAEALPQEQTAIEAVLEEPILGDMAKRIGAQRVSYQHDKSVLGSVALHWFEDRGQCRLRLEYSSNPIAEAWLSE